jgi:hypothetical protein
MDLLPFFEWVYQTSLGEMIRESTWLFPIIEAVHLLGFGLTLGAVLLVDLRLLGAGLSGQPAAVVADGVRSWLIGGVVMMIASGLLLFMSEATKCYYSPAFWVKMASLLLALVFMVTFRRRAVRTDAASNRPMIARMTAVISLGLWFGVAWGGRWIGFS